MLETGERWVGGHFTASNESKSRSSDQLQLLVGHVTYVNLEKVL